MLEIKNLSKSYGSLIALDDINIVFNKGVYGLLGPNGAGKSTLINLITDNIKRQTGEILYNGEDIKKLGRDYRSILGYMPQSQGYYKDFSVIAFLEYIGSVKGMTKKAARSKAEELIEILNLKNKMYARMGNLSGGMKQRVMLSQAMVNNPEILILDEPTAGVDPQERIKIRNYISEISNNKIVIIATHIVSDIEAISDKILIMKEGRIVENDTPEKLIAKVSSKVRDVSVDEKNTLDYLNDKYIVSNLYRAEDGLHAKIISQLDDNIGRECNANLEDVYLNIFGN